MEWPWKKDPLRRVEKNLIKRLRRVEQELKALDPASTQGTVEIQYPPSFRSSNTQSTFYQGKPRFSPKELDNSVSKRPPPGSNSTRGNPSTESLRSSSDSSFKGIQARILMAWRARKEQRRREQERLRNLAVQLRASGSLEDVPLIRYERRVARNRWIGLLLLLGLLALGTIYYLFFY